MYEHPFARVCVVRVLRSKNWFIHIYITILPCNLDACCRRSVLFLCCVIVHFDVVCYHSIIIAIYRWMNPLQYVGRDLKLGFAGLAVTLMSR